MIYNDCIGALERESEGLLNEVLGVWGSDGLHSSESRIRRISRMIGSVLSRAVALESTCLTLDRC